MINFINIINNIKKKNENEWLYLYIFAFIILILFLRAPQIITYGRFWAEEGSVYFKYAYKHSVFETLVYSYLRCGYYYLSANLSAIIASLVRLRYAPMIMTQISFATVTLILYIIYSTPSLVLKKRWMNVIFCLFLVIGPHVVAEVYCNSINLQVYWGIYGILFLFFDFEHISIRKERLLNILFVIACLSGLYCIMLFPIYLMRYLLKKNKKYKKQVIMMLIPLAVQGFVVCYSKFFAGLADTKLSISKINVDGILYSIRHQIIRPLFGLTAANRFTLNQVLLVLFIFIAMVITLLFIVRNQKKDVFYIIFLFALLIYYMMFVIIGSLGAKAGGRYAFIPGSILFLLILFMVQIISSQKLKWLNYIKYILVLLPLYFGCIDYQSSYNWKYLDYNNSPKWEEQVKKFEQDPNYTFIIWPYDREWPLKLK